MALRARPSRRAASGRKGTGDDAGRRRRPGHLVLPEDVLAPKSEELLVRRMIRHLERDDAGRGRPTLLVGEMTQPKVHRGCGRATMRR
ncbi:hypothetical protein SBBP1_260003 [Burkholderiales bacterium]|nr:hypothetical protein SBBP1_260003 [Burkholderiales bacterium]